MDVDYIIIGQGLAGSAVAIQLLNRKRKIAVFDDPDANTSSRIAAGLFNPVTGKKMAKTWLADSIFPYLIDFYRKVEGLSGSRFFHPMPIYRPFVSVEEQNDWMGKSSAPEYAKFLAEVAKGKRFPGVRDELGGVLLKNAGYLDTAAYIGAVNRLIRSHAEYFSVAVEKQKVVIGKDYIRYGDIQAKKVIVCAGAHANLWFDWLPITPLKGETLTIRSTFSHDVIVNRGVYIVPGERPDLWRVGSTYYFHDRVQGITSVAREELERKIGELIDVPFEVTDHHWGFRPTVPDRRPLIGCHPEHPHIIVFNGLGTKGVSLAPYFSGVLIHWLENSGTLHKEVDIERYKSLYWGSPRRV